MIKFIREGICVNREIGVGRGSCRGWGFRKVVIIFRGSVGFFCYWSLSGFYEFYLCWFLRLVWNFRSGLFSLCFGRVGSILFFYVVFLGRFFGK